jgi:hypothetical protein
MRFGAGAGATAFLRGAGVSTLGASFLDSTGLYFGFVFLATIGFGSDDG